MAVTQAQLMDKLKGIEVILSRLLDAMGDMTVSVAIRGGGNGASTIVAKLTELQSLLVTIDASLISIDLDLDILPSIDSELDAITAHLTTLVAVDYATEATLTTMLTEATFVAEDFATETTLATIATETTLSGTNTRLDAIIAEQLVQTAAMLAIEAAQLAGNVIMAVIAASSTLLSGTINLGILTEVVAAPNSGVPDTWEIRVIEINRNNTTQSITPALDEVWELEGLDVEPIGGVPIVELYLFSSDGVELVSLAQATVSTGAVPTGGRYNLAQLLWQYLREMHFGNDTTISITSVPVLAGTEVIKVRLFWRRLR